MSAMWKFVRGSATARQLGEALDDMGVEVGQEFVVAKAPTEELSSLDEAKLGPFASDSETSRKAALQAYPKQGTQRHRIIGLFKTQTGPAEGYTRDQIAERLDMSPNTVRPRLVELIEGGWVRDSGRTRKTPMGRDAEVLVLTAKGWD